MKCAIREINQLVERVRAGQPPDLNGRSEEHYYDPALPNFYIRALSNGTASWTVQWKSHGRQKKIRLGDVLLLDRPTAIKAARELLAKVTLDRLDPVEARRERMKADKVTFALAASLFLEQIKGKIRPATFELRHRYLTGYYCQPLHRLPIDEITREQLQTRIDAVAKQSGQVSARSCHGSLNAFFTWAATTGKLPDGHPNPVTNVQKPAPGEMRARVLTDDEIQLIWKACDELETEIQEMKLGVRTRKGHLSNIASPLSTKLGFLTGMRRQEIGELRWSEIDLENAEVRIPGERPDGTGTKNHYELSNPLSGMAVDILRSCKQRPGDDYVFPPNYGGNYDLGDTKTQINRRIKNAGGVPPKDWTFHDIRRTFRTRMAELGVSETVGEALVGHVSHRGKMNRNYNRYEYWAEKRTAVAMWEANLKAIIDGAPDKIARPQFGKRREKA